MLDSGSVSGQYAMCLVAAHTVRRGDISVFHSHAVKTPHVAGITVRRQPVLPDDLLVFMALAARRRNIFGRDARLGVFHQGQRVFPVTVGAGGALQLAFLQRFPVDADFVLVINLHVTLTTHLPYVNPVGARIRIFRTQYQVRPVTVTANSRADILTLFQETAVDTASRRL